MRRFLSFFLLLSAFISVWSQLPEDFYDELVIGDLPQTTGFTFDDNGRMYLWEKAGKIWIVDNGVRASSPLLDIEEEVGNWGDHGLLSVALHPNFLNNGYIYLLYAVERHYLLYYNTPAYQPGTREPKQPTIGRITRYTADITNNFESILPDSRLVLLGQDKSNGIPLVHFSHGLGSLIFGTDGSLLVGVGDAASFNGVDNGDGDAGSFAPQALIDGILKPEWNVGAFRAQMVDCYNGKILRIDPNTGAGLESNPFYDPADPYAAQSKVWALGLRNPFRFTIWPETGSHHIEDGDPGVIMLGDVGWGYWEEVNLIDQGGLNMGWPMFEGQYGRWQYAAEYTSNPQAVNPLADEPDCARDVLNFQDLLMQTTLNAPVFFPNPCNNQQDLSGALPTFLHHRPIIAWANAIDNHEEQTARVPGYDTEGNAVSYSLDDPMSPVVGDTFTGSCISALLYYENGPFPESWHDKWFFVDFRGWIRTMEFDANRELQAIDIFYTGGEDNMMHFRQDPISGEMYFLVYKESGTDLRKITFGGNPAPTAIIQYDQQYGPSPLAVQFSGAQSFDPDSQALSYHWDFGDGGSSTDIAPVHTFEAASGDPQPFEVILTVTDSEGASRSESVIISLNNSPPQVNITSIAPGSFYTTTGTSTFPLRAEVEDDEHGQSELSYTWQTFLHHNTHNHPEPEDHNIESVALISGEGCEDETYWYRIRLTVADAAGLEGIDERVLLPNCGPPLAIINGLVATATESQVEIFWQARDEQAGMQYEVQRSQDQNLFVTIGTVSTIGLGEYTVIDPAPIWGENFYRIMLVDSTGYFDFSNSVSVSFPSPPAFWTYPNPVQDSWTVLFKEVQGEASVELMDVSGRPVLYREWLGEGLIEQELSLGFLNNGIYVYRLWNGYETDWGKVIVLK